MPYVDPNTKIIPKKFCVFAASTLLSIGLLIPPQSLAQDANKTQPTREPKQMSSAVELKAGTSVAVASTSPSLSSILTQTVIFIYKDNTPQNATRLVPGTVLGTAFIIGVPRSHGVKGRP